jgi:hypothetical protein
MDVGLGFWGARKTGRMDNIYGAQWVDELRLFETLWLCQTIIVFFRHHVIVVNHILCLIPNKYIKKNDDKKKTVGLKFDILVASYSKLLEITFFYSLNTFFYPLNTF